MDRDEEKDLYIKSKLKNGHIPEKIDDLFNNSAKLIENIEQPKKNKSQIILKRVAGIAACVIIVLGGGNIYATTQGYDNVFFMIKEWVAPSDETHGKDEILSDRDITISYKSIEVAKGIKMQINRLVVKDDDAKLYLKIDQSETELDIAPFTYVVRDEKGNEICNYASKKEEITYTEELELEGLKKSAKKLELEVKQNDESTLVKFDIDLENKEIQVIGNEYELQKISEEELKKYLSAFALLNYEDEELNSETVNEDVLENTRKLMVAHQISEINDQTNYDKIIANFTNTEKSLTKKTEIKENIKGLCIDVTDIMYSNGIYTVTFTYCYPTTEDINKNRIEDLPLYEMTIGLTINEDQTYSKYRVSSKMESMLIREGKEDVLVSDVSYIEIQVDNSGKNGLSMTEPLKIENKNTINEIKNIINSGEKVVFNTAGGFWDSCPLLTVYQENGEILTIAAIDEFEMEGEPSGNLITVSKKQDQSDKVIYRVDQKLGAFLEKSYADFTNMYETENKYEEITSELEGIDVVYVTNAVNNKNGTYTLKGVIYTQYTLSPTELKQIVDDEKMKINNETYIIKNSENIDEYNLYLSSSENPFYKIKKNSEEKYYLEAQAQISDVWKLTEQYKEITVDENTVCTHNFREEDSTVKETFEDFEETVPQETTNPDSNKTYKFEFENGKCVKINDYLTSI